MSDFRHRHVRTIPRGHWEPRPRGCATVEDDGAVLIYRVSRKEKRAFKAWVAATFAGMNLKKVRGVWPQYFMEQPQ